MPQSRESGPSRDPGSKGEGVRDAYQVENQRRDRSLDEEVEEESVHVAREGVLESVPQVACVVAVIERDRHEVSYLYPAHVREEVGGDEDHPEEGNDEAEGPRHHGERVSQHAPSEASNAAGELSFDSGCRLLGCARKTPPLVQQFEPHKQVALSGLNQAGESAG